MSLEFLRPAALLALLFLPAVAWLGLRARRLPAGRRRLAVALRLLLLSLIILGLARPRLWQPAGQRAAVLMLDASGSLPVDERARAETFAARVAEVSREDREMALLLFGGDARVDRGMRAGALETPRSEVDDGATDIAAALRLGASLLPAGSSGRLLLASDGRANQGDLSRETALLQARGIPVDILPLAAGVSGAEAWIAGIEAAASARVGQRLNLEVELGATAAGPARLVLLREGEVIGERGLELQPGSQRLRFSDRAEESGPLRYSAILEAQRDGRQENNRAAALTLVSGPPRLALLAGQPERAAALRAALRAAGREVETVDPAALPASPLALSAWDAFLLVDLPASALPPSSQEALGRAVRDLGRGLVMIGGRDSFGAGGWQGSPVEAALPVEMRVGADERRPAIALYFLIDRSSSMGEPVSALRGAPSKLDLAKEAVLQAADLLRPEDQLGVLAFDIAAAASWPLQPAGDRIGLEEALAGIGAQGGTSLTAGLTPARRALAEAEAPRKHAILLSDGWTEVGGIEAALLEATGMAAEGIGLSVVALGADAAQELVDVAAIGGGRHLPAVDAAELPRIFVSETQLVLGSYLVEARFQPLPAEPSPILQGLDVEALPVLDGYNATTAKPGATVALTSLLEDPILAHWQSGLGRAAAWTSDLDIAWAGAWLDGDELPVLAGQLVDWVLPPPESEDLELRTRLDGRRLEVEALLTVEDAAGGDGDSEDVATAVAEDVETVDLRLLGPDGSSIDLGMDAVESRRFESGVELPGEGAWLLRATARDAAGQALLSRNAGIVLPLAPEYADLGGQPTDARLFALAEATGGRVLELEQAEAVFDPVPGARAATELWPWLLTLAALLLPLDVALRRLGLLRALRERWRTRGGSGRTGNRLERPVVTD